MILAPRGFGKSTISTVCFTIWLILCNPDIRILIGSSTAAKSEAFLREIKAHFEQNEKLKELFGDKYSATGWKAADIVVIDRKKIAKEPTISARGWSGAVVGSHYDVHLIDDLVNEDNARTKGQREKLRDWFYMSLDPTLEPEGCRLNIGTRYHPDDIYGHFIEQGKQETIDSGADYDFEPEATRLRPIKILKLSALQPDGSSLWEEKFPVRKLFQKRSRMGIIRFNAQFQNDTELMKGKIFKEEYFEYYNPLEIDPTSLKIFQGVDLNAGQGNTNDFFSLVTKGYDDRNRGYTLDVVHGRYTFREQMMVILWKAGRGVDEIKELLGIPDLDMTKIMSLFKGQPKTARRQYRRVIRIGVESVVYQKMLPDTLIEICATLPVMRINQDLDKETRMMIYASRWENHMEFLPDDNSVDGLKEEALLFPDAEHDDIIDAHEIANRVSAMGWADNIESDEGVQARVF